MAKGKGSTCPHPQCGRQTFHDNDSFRQCSTCGYIGWSWQQPVRGVGKGRGNKCPNCEWLTLHEIVRLPTGHIVRRCGTCDFSGIEPVSQ